LTFFRRKHTQTKFIVEIILLALYGFFLTFILFYSFIQIHLVILYLRKNKTKSKTNVTQADKNLPFVTIQLPLYNESYVVERLIRKVAEIDYPKDKFEIQILDDSSDETTAIAQRVIDELAHTGIDMQLIRRPDRKGFKAGALAYGMTISKGDFYAIFDADFLPEKDFLKKTIPNFQDENIGVVQTRWTHINEDYSLITQLQAFGLDAHFTIEQGGRNYGDHFINFNGTAGVWRKKCIDNAGGWSSDTLTEDLDLSYRAQLLGWKFKYLEEVESPAELPAAIHLMNSFIFICVLSLALLSVPLFLIKEFFPQYDLLFKYSSGFIICLLFLMVFYWVAQRAIEGNFKSTFKNYAWKFPLFLSVSMGLSLHNGIAVFEGYIGRKSPFIRTPKFNLKDSSDKWMGNKYLTSSINMVTWIEGALTFYFLSGVVLSFYYGNFGMLPFFLMLTFGFFIIHYFNCIP